MLKNLPTHVFIISTDKIFSNKLLQKLEVETDYIIFQYSSGEEFFRQTIYNPIPGNASVVVILDYELRSVEFPNAKDGISVLRDIRKSYPALCVITMSDVSMKKVRNDAVQDGAFAHIFKNENTLTRLKAKIHEVENEQNLSKQKKVTRIAIFVFAGFLLILLIVGILFYIFEQ